MHKEPGRRKDRARSRSVDRKSAYQSYRRKFFGGKAHRIHEVDAEESSDDDGSEPEDMSDDEPVEDEPSLEEQGASDPPVRWLLAASWLAAGHC